MLNQIRKALHFSDGTATEVGTLAGRYGTVIEASNLGIIEWDSSRSEVFGNQRAFEILGLTQESGWISQDIVWSVFPHGEKDRVLNMISKMEAGSDTRKLDTYCLDSKGNRTYMQVSARMYFDEGGELKRVVAALSDVSEQRRLEERLRHEALHDFLTGLPNRTLLIDRIQHILTRLKRNDDLNAALLFIDIENFKAVNDNLGHGFGDDVLVSIGERLSDIVRGADTVSRIGSDEFVILLEDPASNANANRFADRLLSELKKPMRVQNKELTLDYSIGMVLINDPETSVEAVLGDAGIAMYAAKDSGRGKVVPFESTMRTQAAKRLDIETALRRAMENNELYLAYQPIFAITKDDPNPVGVEALLRWEKSGRSDIAPHELLTVAEENGMIEDIGLWVIDTAVAQLEDWLAKGYPADFYININLSSRHFDSEEIVNYLLRQIDARKLPRNGLRLEVVESAVIRNPDKALSVIERLKTEGIMVSIDDFGTGFSSLSYLHRFPFHALKIDRSFVIDVIENKATQDIVMAIVLMAHKLGIKVVAEGIETPEQLEFLANVGCELGQGFLMARPETPQLLDRFFVLEGEAELIA